MLARARRAQSAADEMLAQQMVHQQYHDAVPATSTAAAAAAAPVAAAPAAAAVATVYLYLPQYLDDGYIEWPVQQGAPWHDFISLLQDELRQHNFKLLGSCALLVYSVIDHAGNDGFPKPLHERQQVCAKYASMHSHCMQCMHWYTTTLLYETGALSMLSLSYTTLYKCVCTTSDSVDVQVALLPISPRLLPTSPRSTTATEKDSLCCTVCCALLHALQTQILDTASLIDGRQYQVYTKTEDQLVVRDNIATAVEPISVWLAERYGGEVAAVLNHW
jgi:hypothetical protein